MDQQDSHSVGVLTASAGTGKTYALTKNIENDVVAGRDPARVVATTFTVKAADELRERTRGRLLSLGDAKNAVRMLGARVGTINGVCGGLVKEFAFGLGLSPIVEVIDEDGAKAAFIKASHVAVGDHADDLDQLSVLLGIEEWMKDVVRVVELARANNIPETAFGVCRDRSLGGFGKLMETLLPGETETSLDANLFAEAEGLRREFDGVTGLVGLTSAALKEVADFLEVRIERQPWQKWAKLSKLKPAVKDEPKFLGLKAAAAAFARHPRLLAQVEAYVRAVFTCAAAAFLAYEDHKRAWGLVDFVDQERLALELLRKPELEQQLRERLQTVFVDEFQDTNPLQLAVFVAMSRLAGSSVWVGDPKQSIYRFRQTDPDLITYVAQDIRKATGGADLPLDRNWRSRRGLVDFFNDAFAPTFQAHGLPSKATRIAHVERKDLSGQQTPLNVWRAVNGGGSTYVGSLVTGVLDALARSGDWKVADGKEARPLAPGDVAILCRSNPACLSIADALARSGLNVAIEREGLFGTLECRLALAALRWCADRRDGVALAEMAHLFGSGDGQPAWFEASLEEGGFARVEALVPIAESLEDVAEGGRHKTPLEFLDAVLGAGGVSNAVLRWGDVDDRLLNLEALRGVAAGYEEERRRVRAPATVSDLCAWLARQEAKRPASQAKDAVTVMTYHGSKGLEWPLVILTDLDSEPKGDAFGVQIASDVPTSAIDWRDPLAGRWIRFWPWPLGKQAKDVSFDATAANSPEGLEAARAERAERARLLYVGATRARDYLVLAARKVVTKKEQRIETEWLDELRADGGGPVMVVPATDVSTVRVNGVDHPVRVAEFYASADGVATAPSVAFGGSINTPTTHLPLRLRPSDAGRDDEATIVEEIDLGWRMPFSGASDMASVGEAVHRFLAADDPSRHDSWRVALASRLLDAWGVTCLDPRHVVEMGTRFRGFVAGRWPQAVVSREAPILYRVGDRTMSGRLDVVVETPDAIIVVDHKSFPGARTQWLEQARKHAGQLRLYGEAVAASLPMPKTVKLALHLPIAGEVLMVE